MTSSRKYVCLVCGRKFPEGQGIIIKYDNNLTLSFHSSRCAVKFLKLLIERAPKEELRGYVKRIHDELLERQEMIKRAKSKKI